MPIGPRTPLRMLVLLALLAGQLGPAAPIAANGGGDALYAVDESYERVVQPLDPMSLADAGAPLAMAGGPAGSTAFWMSGDGSTAVAGSYSTEAADQPLTVRAVDLRTGLEGRPIVVPGRDAGIVALSHDGSRLLVAYNRYDAGQRRGGYTATWTVHATATGAALSTYELTGLGARWLPTYVDRGVEHMWLQSSTVIASPDPYVPLMGSLVLQHVDLASGTEVGRLTLGSVEVGDVERERIDSLPVHEGVYPAVALSPDGHTLAIVEPATDEIVLVDGLTMTRTGTLAVTQPEPLAGRMLRWAGILPSRAAAKWQVGDWRAATFSADGDAIYLTGGHGEILGDSYDDYEAEWIGVMRVDLATGEIQATALPGHEVYQMLPGADGALYVLSQVRPWVPTVHDSATVTTLRRLDPRTLHVEAERPFPQSMYSVIVSG